MHLRACAKGRRQVTLVACGILTAFLDFVHVCFESLSTVRRLQLFGRVVLPLYLKFEVKVCALEEAWLLMGSAVEKQGQLNKILNTIFGKGSCQL